MPLKYINHKVIRVTIYFPDVVVARFIWGEPTQLL